MGRFLAVLEYDGTGFAGSQVQPAARSVQGELQRALTTLAGVETDVDFAGRTDSGVHAAGQVVGFGLDRPLGAPAVMRALNGLCPRDMAIREAAEAPPAFHPRYWATARRYRYRIVNRPARAPLLERCAWHVAEALDAEAMSVAAGLMLGRHDFGQFGRPPQGDNTRRTILRLTVEVTRPVVSLTVEADAFLRRMVRLLVGTLVDVGRGRLGAEDVRALLAGRSDARRGAAAPAKGLTLEAVSYERQRLGYGTGIWWSSESLTQP